MNNACDRTDANTLAELRNDSGEINYRDQDEWDFNDELTSNEGLAAIAAKNVFDLCPETELAFEEEKAAKIKSVDAIMKLKFGHE